MSPDTSPGKEPCRAPRPGRAQALDRHVGARLRDRRIMLGLSQQELAKLIGVTYQQAYKYERGVNRIAAGRLYEVARALGVGCDYFFIGLDPREPARLAPQQRLLLELARSFAAIPTRRQQEALCSVARALAEPETETAPAA